MGEQIKIPTTVEKKRETVIWRFPLAVLFCLIVLGVAFVDSEWNWVGASDTYAGSLGTGFLVALAIALGTAAVLAYRRRGTLSGEEISSYWLGCTLALIPALAILFGVDEWNWEATGFLVAFAIVLGTGAVLAYWRRGTLSGAEISSYWLGCTLALIPALATFFGALEWNWVGSAIADLGGLATGSLLAFVIVLGTAVVLAYRRRGTLTGADIARYWLGCTLALVVALGSLFGAHRWNWVGLPDLEAGGTMAGFLVALAIALGAAAVLAYRMSRYLIFGAICVCAVAAAVLALVLWWPEGGALKSSLECNETAYEVSTGTEDGQCVTETFRDGRKTIRCEDGSNYASAECGKGCGQSGGAGVCKEVAKTSKPQLETPTNIDEEHASEGKLSIKCGDVLYEISTGTGKGVCAWTGSLPRTMIQCSDGEGFASASCTKGCEKVRGSGSCEVIKLR
jgi:hypothetical protein